MLLHNLSLGKRMTPRQTAPTKKDGSQEQRCNERPLDWLNRVGIVPGHFYHERPANTIVRRSMVAPAST